MASLRESLRLAGRSFRANLLPGLVLQGVLVVFLYLYLTHGGMQNFLARVAETKEVAGFWFAFWSYVFAGAFLPEVLRVVLFQRGRLTRKNLWEFFSSAPMWGMVGMLVDLLYRMQNMWFGIGNDWQTLGQKVLVDQLLVSPFIINPFILSWLLWRDEGFRFSVRHKIASLEFVFDRLFPVQVAGWCVWFPGVTLVYFMPPLLELPVAVFIQCFWVLALTTINYRVAQQKKQK